MENVGKKKERKIRRMREQKPKPLSLLSKKKKYQFSLFYDHFLNSLSNSVHVSQPLEESIMEA